MQIKDFDFDLPAELIAQIPLPERSASRLLVVDPGQANLSDRRFADLGEYLQPGDLLVFNDTRVIPARLFGRKSTGGKVEVMVERVLDAESLLAHVRASKAPKPGSDLILEGHIACRVVDREQDLFLLRQLNGSWLELLECYGHVPLPPYIQRVDVDADRERYQTVYACNPGAVAAPTAGLHFDEAMLQSLRKMGVDTAHLTLHVGAGTFQPIRGDDIDNHVMHAERVEVPAVTVATIAAAQQRGGRIIAVGTTVVRSLETAAAAGKLSVYDGESRLFIKPGYQFQVVDAMLTNFHLPRSTLLMLVSAFGGTDTMRRAYAHAIDGQYRFFSYGDAMFISARATQDTR
ncbi:MAG: tRNA preQ1(34) S-adenosylmethionine ribosyltransferase-isomerase QueA [Gammaproteobacteria bacterium]|jgi:S-adenosylmethionine:tRNA ribosyltransferase-isomerase|nr:tRNA preQ1(34) S-adenosylmethionine ribosyltransferase-isomerase QueA [Gammaproteobacteria bacterium]